MKKTLHPAWYAALAFGASAACLFAQTPSPGPHGPPDGPPQHHGPPPSPLLEALDTNHDGVLSADEIANAPAVLKTLAGASGQITRESLRPTHPGGPGDQKGGPDDARRPAGPEKDDREDSANPPADRHHGPARPDGERGQNRHPAPATDPAASPSGNASPSSDQQGPPRHHGPPHGGPLFDALDANHDGTISADEIANASAALKTLDKNNDGQLTHDELRPPPPPRDPAN